MLGSFEALHDWCASFQKRGKVLGLLLAVLWMMIVLSWEVEHSVVWSRSLGIAKDCLWHVHGPEDRNVGRPRS